MSAPSIPEIAEWIGSWFSIAASKVYDAEYNPLKDDPSLSGYLSFLRSTMLLSGLDNFALFNILAVFGILVTAITYLTLLRGRTRTIYGLCMCTLLPIALFFQLLQGYVLGLSLPLLILGASLLVDRERFSPSRSKAILHSNTVLIIIHLALGLRRILRLDALIPYLLEKNLASIIKDPYADSTDQCLCCRLDFSI